MVHNSFKSHENWTQPQAVGHTDRYDVLLDYCHHKRTQFAPNASTPKCVKCAAGKYQDKAGEVSCDD